MKRNISLKSIIISLLLVTGSVSYSAPAIGSGTGTDSIVAGEANEATEEKSLAFGHGNKAKGKYSSAFGYMNEANGLRSSAFGAGNKADGEDSSAFGNINKVSGKESSVLGSKYEVTGEKSGAFGVGSWDTSKYIYKNEGNNSYMIGNYNKITSGSNNNFILGNNVTIGSGIQNSVALGNNSTVSSSNEVSVGSASQKRKITNVADGEVSATSTNAITGKQLYNGDGIDVNKWRTKLGVSSSGGTSGGITNSTTMTGSTALGVDNTVTGNYSTAVGYKNKVSGNRSGTFGDPNIVTGNGSYAVGNDNTINGDNNFVLGNNVTITSGIQNSVALGNNSTVSSSNEVSVGSASQKRKITNVADGEVSATSSDAVTGKQLYKVMQNSGALGVENLRNEVNEKIDNVKDEVRGVGSLSAALAGLHPMQYDPKAPAQVMASLGHYKNRQAVAVGASYYFNDKFMMSTGVALSGEKRTEAMANVGFTLKIGKGSGTTYTETPQYIVQNEVKRLTVENQELKERLRNLEKKLEILLKNK